MSGKAKGLALIDSNVIIYATKGIVDLGQIVQEYSLVLTSVICYAEVAGYAFESEAQEAAVREVLSNIRVLPLDVEIANHAIRYRKARKIKLPDALILATARHSGSDLLTFNQKDFIGLDSDVRVIVPGEKT